MASLQRSTVPRGTALPSSLMDVSWAPQQEGTMHRISGPALTAQFPQFVAPQLLDLLQKGLGLVHCQASSVGCSKRRNPV